MAEQTTTGKPVQGMTNAVVVQPTPSANPFLEPRNYMELGGLVLMVAAVFALIERRMEKRRKDDQELHRHSHDAINKDIGVIKHDIKNNETAIQALASNHTSNVERIVKLEIGQQNIEKGQARIEHSMEKNHRETLDQIKAWADQFAESIREVRDVKPR